MPVVFSEMMLCEAFVKDFGGAEVSGFPKEFFWAAKIPNGLQGFPVFCVIKIMAIPVGRPCAVRWLLAAAHRLLLCECLAHGSSQAKALLRREKSGKIRMSFLMVYG